ncbi:uncharacterized protein C8Q71DRAFT_581943 [Rhodofomes roseus]|uniref:Uncharacterized protein n=1 Tax=Rhodofomes roseus TaxID=34475 RepID=A0ABQ8KHA3_9APHY|nr:uncharacterized protein C8Q71DRAFT_581943 [Rhodofomes roseus]KAH9837019.1 hypothetical protein C8Q71DRAFT_581943 [Rhodofomes roseus]
MIHAASFVPNLPASFPSILLAAASRAWTRTKPGRVPLGGSVRGYATASEAQRKGGRRFQKTSGALVEDVEEAGPSTSLFTGVKGDASRNIVTRGRSVSHLSAKRAESEVLSRKDARTNFQGSGGLSTHVAESAARMATFRAFRAGRPLRPLVWHNPWRTPVIEFHVDSVPMRELLAKDRGRAYHSYKTDPPWPEIAEALSASGSRPCVVHYGPFEYSGTSSVPLPTSSEDLCDKLVFFQTLRPPASLEWLIRYHANFREHHSTATFNFLLALAIRMARRGTAASLFIQMEKEAIRPNSHTRQLRVRFLIRLEEGGWQRAWTEQMELSREENKPLPFMVWLEFLGTEKEGATRKMQRNDATGEYALEPVKPADPETLQSRFRILMQNMPALRAQKLARTPIAVVYRVVRHLIRADQPQLAFDVTKASFIDLPGRLDENTRERCLAVIHLHLLPLRRRGQRGHFMLRKLMYRFLAMHSDLRPNATTLRLLMRPLRPLRPFLRAQGGSTATHLVKTFVRRWGPSVVDDQVRRRLATLLLTQGRLSACAAIVHAQNNVELWRKAAATEEEVTFRDSRPARVRRAPAPAHARYVFQRRSAELWRWRLLRRRLRRKILQQQARRASRGP